MKIIRLYESACDETTSSLLTIGREYAPSIRRAADRKVRGERRNGNGSQRHVGLFNDDEESNRHVEAILRCINSNKALR